MENTFNLKKFLAEGALLKEKSWADVDREIAADNQQREADKENFLSTAKGRNAVQVISNLISKPYDTSDLRDVLEILSLTSKQFNFAAEEAGMKFTTDGAGKHISDENYSDPDVAISNINGTWYVG